MKSGEIILDKMDSKSLQKMMKESRIRVKKRI